MEDKAWEVELLAIREKNTSPEEFFWNQMKKRNLKIDVDTINVLILYLVQVQKIKVDEGLKIKKFLKYCIKNHLIKEE